MTDIRFYHLQNMSVDQALPRLVEKIYGLGHKIVVWTHSPEHVYHLDSLLWTFRSGAFLPHGREGDPYPGQHPIWITSTYENPWGGNVLVILGGQEYPKNAEFSIVLDIFNGSVEDDVKNARRRWTNYHNLGHNLTYWQQGDDGSWHQKN